MFHTGWPPPAVVAECYVTGFRLFNSVLLMIADVFAYTERHNRV
jgi:hypothetical protein